MFDIEVKSYRYLRAAIVGLLVALGAAVVYEIALRGRPLESVSGYYYTPARGIFVGSLIGLGACMIALKGTTAAEDILLNVGGMFAAVVAIVPTAGDEAYQTAVAACNQGLLPPPTGPDCPTVEALARATRANVENNMTTLLVLGGLGLLVTLYFARWDQKRNDRAGSGFGWGLAAAFVVLAVGGVALYAARTQFIDYAHYVAAIGLCVCVLLVALVNGVRRRSEEKTVGAAVPRQRATGESPAPAQTVKAIAEVMIRRPGELDRYAWYVWVVLAFAVIFGALWAFDIISLFWLEIGVAVLFAAFWIMQTGERMRLERTNNGGAEAADSVKEPVV